MCVCALRGLCHSPLRLGVLVGSVKEEEDETGKKGKRKGGREGSEGGREAEREAERDRGRDRGRERWRERGREGRKSKLESNLMCEMRSVICQNTSINPRSDS